MVDSPVRVLHVTKSLSLGGTEKTMQLLVANLDRTRFNPAVFCPQNGIRAKQIRAFGIPTFITPYVQIALEQFRPTIVHLHRAGWPEPDMLLSLKRAKMPVVVETNVFGRHDTTHTAEIIDHSLFVSHFCLDRFAMTTGITPHPDRHSVMYNPVDTDFFLSSARTDRDFSRPIAGRISRPDPGKWSHLALDFLPGIIRDIPDFQYHIIGGIPAAVDYVRDNQLSANVFFHDLVETDQEIAAFLDNVSVLAHANDTGESFGMVIAEAMACGLPVVTHPSVDLRDNAQLELVEPSITGLVASNAEEYGNALKYLFSHPEEARRMGLAGQEKARKLYRVQLLARQLETLYQEILDRKGLTP